MYKIGIIDTMKDKGIALLMNYKDFDCEIVTDLSRENLLLKLIPFNKSNSEPSTSIIARSIFFISNNFLSQ